MGRSDDRTDRGSGRDRPRSEGDGDAAGDRSGPPDLEVVSVGGAMVDSYYRLSNLPAPDGGSFARETWREFGGAAANVACALGRLGRDAAMITRLGTDRGGESYADADAVTADLEEHGVDVQRVRRGEETGTYSLVLAGPDGRRMVVTGGESVSSMTLQPGDWPYLRATDVAVTNAYAPDPVVSSLVSARRDGDLSLLAFDLSGPLPELEGRGVTPATVDEVVAASDLFVAGAVALGSYCDHHGVDESVDGATDLLRDLGVGRAALTRGEEGATLVSRDGRTRVDAHRVDAVDTTGAGDGFFGGLIDAWLLDGRTPTAAGRFAAAVAALNCTAEGARGGLPTRADVEEFLGTAPGASGEDP